MIFLRPRPTESYCFSFCFAKLRAESSLLKEHVEAQAKELSHWKQQVEELEEKERVAKENVSILYTFTVYIFNMQCSYWYRETSFIHVRLRKCISNSIILMPVHILMFVLQSRLKGLCWTLLLLKKKSEGGK